jgi:hypothetical protein
MSAASAQASALEPSTGRAAVNRQNAQLSTGPRTEAGKLRSSLNALRHGLTSRTLVLPTEDPADYAAHLQRFIQQFQPSGPLEEQLVQSLADTTWRLNRIPALEAGLLSAGLQQNADAIDPADPDTLDLALAQALTQQTRALAALSMNEQRLSRQFDRTLKQLREIQAERREAEAEQAATRLNVAEVRTADGKTGFVLSEDPIDAWLQRHQAQESAPAFRPERRLAARAAAAAASNA